MTYELYENLSDCLEGTTHPVVTPGFFGHEAEIRFIEQALISGRFHHGWIFSGPRGVGKATLAYHLARVMLHRGPGELDGSGLLALSETIRSEKTGRLIAQFAHPDMRVLRRSYDQKKKNFSSFIRIDEMRASKEMLSTTASMGGYRLVLIDRAEDMNEASSNALLKMLEEPPSKTMFVLITNSPGQIPVTVRSRCQMLKFHGLDFEAFQQALNGQFEGAEVPLPADIDWQDLWHLADGSPRAGFELITGDGLKFYKTLVHIFEGLPVLDGRLLDQFIDGVLKDRTGKSFTQAQQMLEDMLHRLIRGSATGALLSAREARLKDHMIKSGTIDQWVMLWDTLLKKSLERDEYNLDKKTHLLTSFFALRDLVRAI